LTANAQHLSTQNFMRYNPYFNVDNPAHHTPYKGYIGFPALSSFNVSLSSTFLRYDKIIRFDNEGYPIAMNTEQLLGLLSKKNNWFNFSLNEEILGFGFRTGPVFFSFSTRTRVDQYFQFSEDLLKLPILGNMSFVGDNNPADISANISLDAYQEFSLGVQVEVNKKLYVGARPKLLIGIAKIRTDELNAKIYTNPTDYTMTIDYNADLSIVSSMPMIWQGDSLYIDKQGITSAGKAMENLGFSIDLGAVYRINDKMGVGLSLLDLGFIQWKTNGVRLRSSLDDAGSFYNNGSFIFNGLTANQIALFLNDAESREEFLDSLSHYFPVNVQNISGERISLTTRLGAEFYYQLNEKHRFTAYFMGTFLGKNFHPQFSLAYNGKLAKVLDVCAHYTMRPNSFANFGIGLGFDVKPFYLYFGTDNIIAAFARFKADLISFQLGLVFKWGKVKEKRIKELPKEETKI
jgi:hypothetical protein